MHSSVRSRYFFHAQTMTDEILEPALPREEWRAWEDAEGADRAALENAMTAVGRMATANAAMPDASPYKITREDVQVLRLAAMLVRATTVTDAGVPEAPGSDPYASNRALTTSAAIERVSAKLAALLPPP